MNRLTTTTLFLALCLACPASGRAVEVPTPIKTDWLAQDGRATSDPAYLHACAERRRSAQACR